MKKKFKVFYEEKILDFESLDDTALIVLDANVLLHFFRYSQKSQKKLFSALERVRHNLFIPYQAALEYHYERQNVTRSNKKNIEKLTMNSDNAKIAFQSEIKRHIEEYGGTIRSTDEQSIREEVIKEFDKLTDQFWEAFSENTLKKLTDIIPDNTETAYKIADLLEDKVGEPLSPKEIDTISTAGSSRYSKKIPPGYKDSNKENDIRTFGEYSYDKQYGDLILWEEIKRYCQNNGNIETVIFVSEDEKEDWIFKSKGEKVGVRVELKQELHELVGARLEIFSPKKFLYLLSNEKDLIKDYSGYHRSGIRQSILFMRTKRRLDSLKMHLEYLDLDELSERRFYENNKKIENSNITIEDFYSQFIFLNEIFFEEFTEFKMLVSDWHPAFESDNTDLYNSILSQVNEIEHEFMNYKHFYSLDRVKTNIEAMSYIINSCDLLYESLQTIIAF
jgi:predicted nucleic acid-binding protein